jgi:hypothetical protein
MDGGYVIREARLGGPLVLAYFSHRPELQNAGDGVGPLSMCNRLHDRYEVAA